MLKTTADLIRDLRSYSNPNTKIQRMVRDGELVRIRRGLYETNLDVDGNRLASTIYGPSYLSFEYALSYHNMIPEGVRSYTSATFGKNRKKVFKTVFGRFTYRDVPLEAYEIGVLSTEEDGYIIRIASPEKALCDKVYSMPSVDTVEDIDHLLFDDLRLYEDDIMSLDKNMIRSLTEKYRSHNVRLLSDYLEESNHGYNCGQIQGP